MLTIDPPPAWIMCGIAYFEAQNTFPVRLVRMIWFHSSVVYSTIGLMLTFTTSVAAALFTSVVNVPKCSTVASIAARTLSSSLTSSGTKIASPPASRMIADDLLALLDGATRDRNLGALGREHLGGRASDAPRRPADERDLPCKSHVRNSLRRLPATRPRNARERARRGWHPTVSARHCVHLEPTRAGRLGLCHRPRQQGDHLGDETQETWWQRETRTWSARSRSGSR